MTATLTEKQPRSVPWTHVAFYTTCPMVSASNMDQELGWTGGEFKKTGVDYPCFRSRSENNFCPHCVHNLDNLIRMGGLYPAIHVNAGIRRTRMHSETPCPSRARCAPVRPMPPDEGMPPP